MRLEAKELIHFYGKRKVLDGVAIQAESGQIVGLLGPNGAGKTTTFRILAGLLKPVSGVVSLDHNLVTTLPLYRRSRLGLVYLPQESSIFRALTSLENILVALSPRIKSAAESKKRAEALLEEFELTRVKDQPSHTLSGGERRRLEIARALAAEPKILMLDEPFTGVDPIAVDELTKLMKKLRDRGIGIVLTDHNARETLKVIDRAYLIYSGKILMEGSAQQLLDDERARRVYLGWDMRL